MPKIYDLKELMVSINTALINWGDETQQKRILNWAQISRREKVQKQLEVFQKFLYDSGLTPEQALKPLISHLKTYDRDFYVNMLGGAFHSKIILKYFRDMSDMYPDSYKKEAAFLSIDDPTARKMFEAHETVKNLKKFSRDVFNSEFTEDTMKTIKDLVREYFPDFKDWSNRDLLRKYYVMSCFMADKSISRHYLYFIPEFTEMYEQSSQIDGEFNKTFELFNSTPVVRYNYLKYYSALVGKPMEDQIVSGLG